MLEAARRVKEAGARMHFFAVGRVFEQEDVDWLRDIVEAEHLVGNHTELVNKHSDRATIVGLEVIARQVRG